MDCPILENVQFSISRRKGCQTLIKEKLALLDTSYIGTPVLMINRLFNNLGSEYVAPTIYFTKPYDKPSNELALEFKNDYIKTICRISRNHPVYILKPIPEASFSVPKKLLRESLFGKTATTEGISLERYYQLNHFIIETLEDAHKQCGATLLDPLPYLCPNGKCMVSHDEKPLYFDDNHLSEYGNKLLIPLFKQIFNP